MKGDDRKRYCDACKLHVYNLAGMTRPEVETLIGGGEACVRLFRRKDGTVLTQDCPVGVRAATRRFIGTMAASLVVLFGALAWGVNELRDGDRIDWGRLAGIQPIKSVISLIHKVLPPAPPPEPEEYVMGKFVLPTPPSPRPTK